jgi:hypothetical protein
VKSNDNKTSYFGPVWIGNYLKTVVAWLKLFILRSLNVLNFERINQIFTFNKFRMISITYGSQDRSIHIATGYEWAGC